MKWTVGIGTCGVIFAVYLKTTYPSLPGGDSGELILAAQELGVAHPPGYPIFTVLSHLCIKTIPVGSVAWRVNVLSIVLSTLAAFFIFITLARLCMNLSSCVFGVGMFSFMRLTWTWNITAEVFSLNNFFISLLMFMTVYFEDVAKTKKVQVAYLGSFISGLSLCNQHTIVIYVFCIVIWVIYNLHHQKLLGLGVFGRLCFWFCCGLLPYLYIPISAYSNVARWTWGDQRTLSGFIQHLLRREYGTFELLKNHEGQGLLKGLSAFINHLINEVGYVGMVASLLSVVSVARRLSTRRSCTCIFYIMMMVYLLIFTSLANLDINNLLFLGVVERFWIQVDLVLSLLVAILFDDIFSCIMKYMSILRGLKIDFIVAAVFTVAFINKNYSACDNSNNTVVIDFAKGVLDSFPPNALVLTKGDLPSNSIRYVQLSENTRPDITSFDQEVLTFEWSLPMLKHHYPDIVFPGDLLYSASGKLNDGRTAFDFNNLLDSNSKRPIFACIGVQDHEPSWQRSYELWPHGVCSKFVRKGSVIDVKQLVEDSEAFVMKWPYPYNRFEKTSWEHVATQEMWDAKTTLGLVFLEKSELYEKTEEKLFLLQYSYEIYHRAMNTTEEYPVHWHKNLALVCEKLSHLKPDSHKQLMAESVREFEKFVELDQTDKDYHKIIEAIKSLTNYLKQLE